MKDQFKPTNNVEMVFKKWANKRFAIYKSLKKQVKIATLCLAYSIIIKPDIALGQTDTTVAKNLDLEEIVVSAQKSPVVYSQLSRVVTTIDKQQIKEIPATTINELLETVSAVDVRQRGANGVQADISIRGGTFDQNLILLNGVNISDPQTGHHSLNLPIDLNAVEKIEILEGPGSRVFGPNAYSGAINIITNNSGGKFIKAKISAGEYGLYNGNLSTSYIFNNWSHFISLSKSKSKGFTENTDFDHLNVFYSTNYALRNSSVDFQIGYTNKQFGANSFYTPKYPSQFEQTKTTFASLRFESGDDIKLIPVVYFRRHQDLFELFREDDYKRVGNYFIKNENDTAKYYPGVYDSWNYYNGHNYHLTDVYGVKIDTRIKNKFGITSLGVELRSENIWSNVLGNPMNDTIKAIGEEYGEYTKSYSRTISNYFIEHAAYIGNLSMSAGLLASWVNENHFDFNFHPGFEMSYKFIKHYNIYISINKSLRLPTFTDLFYNGPDNIGNPNLKPEEAISYEWGLKATTDNIKSSFSLFYRDATNVIAWVKDTAALETDKWETQNLTDVYTFGIEFNNTIRINRLTINYIKFNYAYLNQTASSLNKFDTKYSLNYLKHNLCIGVNHKIINNLNFTWNLKYQDRVGKYPKFMGLGIDDRITNYDPYWLVDLKLNYTYKVLNLYVEVTNLLNHNYVELGNVKSPGRWIKAGFDVHIGYKFFD